MGSHTVNDEKLLAYAAGELPGDEVERVRRYLSLDPQARAMVERYRQVAATVAGDDSVPVPPAVLRRARSIFQSAAARRGLPWLEKLDELVARLLFDSRAQPALAGLRGPGEGFHATYEAESVQIDLEATPHGDSDQAQAGRWQVIGQVSGAVGEAVDVALARAGTREPVAVTSADEHGVFTIEAPADRYDLLVRAGEAAVVVPDVELG